MKKRHTFQKTILLFACLSCVLLLCFFWIFKFFFQPQFRQHMLDEAQLSCNLSQKMLEEQLMTLMDSAANRFLSESDRLGSNSPLVLGAHEKLTMSEILPIRQVLREISYQYYIQSSPLFYAIDVYFPNSDLGITSNAGLVSSEENDKRFNLRRDNVKWIQNSNEFHQGEIFIQQYQIKRADNSPAEAISFSRILHFYDSVSTRDVPMVLTFVLRRSTLSLLLTSEESANVSGGIFLQDKDGRLAHIAGEDHSTTVQQLQQEGTASSDFFLLVADHSRGSLQVLRLLDIKEMERSLDSQQTFFLIAMLILFILAMFLSYSASKNLYRPLDKSMYKISSLECTSPDSLNEYSYLETAMSALADRADTLETTLKANQPMIKNALLLRLIYGRLEDEEELDWRCRLSGIQLTGSVFFAAVLRIDLMTFSPEEENEYQFVKIRMMESIEKLSKESLGCYCAETEYNEIAVILNGNQEDMQSVCTNIEQIVASFERLLHCSVVIGVSQPKQSLHELRKAYRQAYRASENAFFLEKNEKKLFFYQSEWSEPLLLPSSITDSFWQALKPPNLEEAMTAYQDVLQEMSKGGYTAAYCQPLLANMEAQLSDLLHRRGVDWTAATRTSLQAYRDHFKQAQIMLHAIENEKVESANHLSIQLVLNAVTSDLTRNLSLDEAAELVHFSPVYFSKLFKETLGINFKDYVQEVKMRRAVELLGDEKRTIQEIAELLGYANANYFGKRFKQYFHMTPGTYRDHLLHQKE